jgi:hypothetical protein
MFRKIERLSAVALGMVFLMNGLTFGLALIVAIELYMSRKKVNG